MIKPLLLSELIAKARHLSIKRYTQSIKRQNFNFHTSIKHLARKTLCFSNSIEVYDKGISEFINCIFFNFSQA